MTVHCAQLCKALGKIVCGVDGLEYIHLSAQFLCFKEGYYRGFVENVIVAGKAVSSVCNGIDGVALLTELLYSLPNCTSCHSQRYGYLVA